MNRHFTKALLSSALISTNIFSATAQQQITAVLNTPRTDVYINETVPLTLSVRAQGLTLGQQFTLQNLPSDDQLKRISELSEMPVKRETQNNQIVETHEFKVDVRPVSPGIIRINTRLQFTVLTRQRSFWGTSTVQQQAAIDVAPLTLRAINPPEIGRPANFQNAIGKFSFNVKIEPSDVAVGDLITLIMTVKGNGYLDEMRSPPVAISQNFKAYDPQVVENASGIKSFEQIIIPVNTNANEVGMISFSFFDPDARTYKTISQGPFPLTFHQETSVVLKHFRPNSASTNEIQHINTAVKNVNERYSIDSASNASWLLHGTQARTTQKNSARFAPARSALIGFEIPEGAIVRIIETYTEWAKVEYNNNRGWFPASALSSK